MQEEKHFGSRQPQLPDPPRKSEGKKGEAKKNFCQLKSRKKKRKRNETKGNTRWANQMNAKFRLSSSSSTELGIWLVYIPYPQPNPFPRICNHHTDFHKHSACAANRKASQANELPACGKEKARSSCRKCRQMYRQTDWGRERGREWERERERERAKLLCATGLVRYPFCCNFKLFSMRLWLAASRGKQHKCLHICCACVCVRVACDKCCPKYTQCTQAMGILGGLCLR